MSCYRESVLKKKQEGELIVLGSSLVSYLDFNKIQLHFKLFHCVWQYGSDWLCGFKKFCSQEECVHCV